MPESVNLREQASNGRVARANPGRYNMSTVDRGVFAVTCWRDGVQTAIALVPISTVTDQWARDFCAWQNQAPDDRREADFVRRAARLYRKHVQRVRGIA